LMPALVALAAVSCSGGRTGPGMQTDSDQRSSDMRAAEGSGELCTPDCAGKQCGPDACGGGCGDCAKAVETCSEAGQCEPFTCKSTKDCPGDLVCAPELGECVECVGDEDCPEAMRCGADYACHEEHPCGSDKDCKAYDMVCDKDAGQCVQCLKAEHCAEGEFCKDGFCIETLCVAAGLKCEGTDVLVCAADGSGWAPSVTCTDQQYCNAGECKDCLCTPSAAYCDGDVMKECSDDCKSVVSEEDCAAKQEHCFKGNCLATVCEPGAKFCSDPATAATCLADGMDFSSLPCDAGQYCEDSKGECVAQVCSPGNAECVGTVAKTCNTIGSAYASQVDCKVQGKVCVNGQCLDLACPPSTDFCVDGDTLGHCSADGLSSTNEDCKAQSSCKDGQCQPWQCTPKSPLCVGEVATKCDALGFGPVPGGTDCSKNGKFCSNGECVACSPDCTGKDCGEDGCGGSCGSCNDGLPCTSDSCSLGQCQFPIDQFQCVIKGSCVPSGTEDPASVCRKCNPAKSQTDWSNVDDQTPCGGGGLACHGGVCCIYNCVGKECGADGCGGSCGTCLPGISCNAGLCTGCSDGNAVDWDGCTGGALSEFQVNSLTTSDQEKPSVAAHPQGDYMVVWESKLMGSADVYGRVFSDAGTPTAPEFILHSNLDNWQHDSQVAALSDGRGAVVWESFVANQVGASVWVQLVNADGTKSGPEIKVNDVDGKWMTYRPDVASFEKGGFVVVWTRNSTWPDVDQSTTIRIRRFAVDGSKLGAETSITGASVDLPVVATFQDGGFVVAWKVGSSDMYLYWQQFNSSGFPLGAQTKLADQASLAGLASTPGGTFVVTWPYLDASLHPKTVFARLFTKDTGPVSDAFQVSPSNDITGYSFVRPAMRADGSFVVAWSSAKTGSVMGDVWVQLVDAAGAKVGGLLQANVFTDSYQANPDVALSADGTAIVVWVSPNQDGNGMGIFAQRFDKNGNKLYH